jgi:hypothetical protein
MRYSPNGMMNMKPYVVPINVGNATHMYSKGIGTYHGKVIKKDGATFNIVFQEVLYVPELYMNIGIDTQ